MSQVLVTVTEAAHELGRSRWYIDQLIADGLLETRRRGNRGRRYITRASLDAWVGAGQPAPSAPEPVYVIPAQVQVRVRGRAA